MTVSALCLFLTMPWVDMWSVFVAFPGQTHLLIERNSSATFQTAIVSGNLDTCMTRVKSGIFGQTAKFGQPPCLFHSSVIGIKK